MTTSERRWPASSGVAPQRRRDTGERADGQQVHRAGRRGGGGREPVRGVVGRSGSGPRGRRRRRREVSQQGALVAGPPDLRARQRRGGTGAHGQAAPRLLERSRTGDARELQQARRGTGAQVGVSVDGGDADQLHLGGAEQQGEGEGIVDVGAQVGVEHHAPPRGRSVGGVVRGGVRGHGPQPVSTADGWRGLTG
ncbi:MAG: hypothetical protein PGN11_15455 [Quadrisphaera sp.]